jgi:hypothetical protein
MVYVCPYAKSISESSLLKLGIKMAYRNYSVSDGFLVRQDGNGDFLTITAALTAAFTSGYQGTIVVGPGTYMGNLTMIAGVDIVSWTGSASTSATVIQGTINCSYSGTCSISGIELLTNSANIVSLTGANATILNIYDSFLSCTNNTGISSTGSNSAAAVNIYNCTGGLSTTGIAYFSSTNGSFFLEGCILNNGGLSTTANTQSGGPLTYINCFVGNPTTLSGTTAKLLVYSTRFDTSGVNSAAINQNATTGAAPFFVENSSFSTGSATPITIGASATLTVSNISLNSTNSAAISGAGTLVYGGTLAQENTIGTLSATTLTPKGTIGNQSSTAPTAGYIGETLTTQNSAGVSTSVNTITNITSFTPTAGTWIITGKLVYSFSVAVAPTTIQGALATSSSNFTPIDGLAVSPATAETQYNLTTANTPTQSLGPATVNTAGATTYYLNAYVAATSATVTVTGVIQARRIA